MTPDRGSKVERQVQLQSLRNACKLDEAMVGVDLAEDETPVVVAASMEELISGASARDRSHLHHPEVIGVGSECVDSLFERCLDLEAIPVESQDANGVQAEISAQQDHFSTGGMFNQHEAYEPPYRAPEQVDRAIENLHVTLAIDGALSGLEMLLLCPEIPQTDFIAIQPRTTTFLLSRTGRRMEGNDVASCSSDKVVPLLDERKDDFPTGVIGIGKEIGRLRQLLGDPKEEAGKLVEEGSLSGLGNRSSLDSLVYSAGEWHGDDMPQTATDKQAEGLKGMSKDVRRFGVVARLLV